MFFNLTFSSYSLFINLNSKCSILVRYFLQFWCYLFDNQISFAYIYVCICIDVSSCKLSCFCICINFDANLYNICLFCIICELCSICKICAFFIICFKLISILMLHAFCCINCRIVFSFCLFNFATYQFAVELNSLCFHCMLFICNLSYDYWLIVSFCFDIIVFNWLIDHAFNF